MVPIPLWPRNQAPFTTITYRRVSILYPKLPGELSSLWNHLNNFTNTIRQRSIIWNLFQKKPVSSFRTHQLCLLIFDGWIEWITHYSNQILTVSEFFHACGDLHFWRLSLWSIHPRFLAAENKHDEVQHSLHHVLSLSYVHPTLG